MKKIFYILVTALFLGACNSDSYENPGKEEYENLKFLSFTLKNSTESGTEGAVARNEIQMRGGVPADEDYNENIIDFGASNKDVHIFIFNLAGTECLFYPEPARLTLVSDPSVPGEKIISIKLVPDESDDFAEFDSHMVLGKNTLIYVVANSGYDRTRFMDGERVKPLEEIRSLNIESVFNEVEDGLIEKQDKFVMEALKEVYIGPWTNAATLDLERAASKVQAGIFKMEVDGYTAASSEVKLVNFVNKSSLGKRYAYSPSDAEYIKDADYIELPVASPEMKYSEPLYSYESDWGASVDNEAYLLIKVMWYKNSEGAGSAQSYYYKLPISSLSSDSQADPAYRYKFKRNHIYRYSVSITALGGGDPFSPVTLDANLEIADWTTENIVTSIQKLDWLMVDEHNITIYPVPKQEVQEYLIPYKSNSPLFFAAGEGVRATFEEFYNGAMHERNYADPYYVSKFPGQVPTVDVNYVVGSQRYIRILSKTPVNYMPKNITFKVQNDAQLFAEIKVVHYPAIYVTSERSKSNYENNNGSGYLYTITTIALTGKENFDWGWTSDNNLKQKQYTVGDPKTSSNGSSYVDNKENAWVVSPKFVIQSTSGYYTFLGANATLTISNSKSRCFDRYWETTHEGSDYKAKSWRLPTMAELYLIHKVQSDPNSSIQNALAPALGAKRAWAAGTWLLDEKTQYRSATFFNMASGYSDSFKGGGDHTAGILHVPLCVRDIYRGDK